MKHLLSILLLLPVIVLSPVLAQEADISYSRDFPVGNFDRIEIEGNYKVFLYQSSKPYLKVKAPSDDLYDDLDIDTDGNTLKVTVRRVNLNLNRTELHIGFNDLKDLKVSGGMKLVTDGYIEVNNLGILVEGAANVDMNLKAKNIDIVSNGGSIFELEGVADQLSVKVTGAGHINARELIAKDVIFRVEGVGFGSVHATNLLDVKIEGVGKVTFKGKPELKRIIEGLGKVEEY